jgi:glycerol uptake facilitator-like aquaporin
VRRPSISSLPYATTPPARSVLFGIALLDPVSGAHFNPAVSFVEALRGKLTLRQTVAHVIVKLLAAAPAHF